MIGVKVTNLDLTEQRLRNAEKGLSDLSSLAVKLGRLGKDQTIQRFYDQKDPNGIPWATLQSQTIKRKSGRTDRLMDRLDLIKSITFTPFDGGVFIHSDLPNERVAPHQFGNDDRNLPKRAIFGLSAENRSEMEDAAIEWLEGLF